MHFIPQKQHFSDEDYKKLVGMYITTEAWDRFITAYNILINPDNNETYEQALISIFKRLTISLPFDLIAKIFRETGIIVLRPPLDNNRTLLVGCGNRPVVRDYSSNSVFVFIDKKIILIDTGYEMARNAFFANKHEHLPDLTINIDARFDSTMIGCFGPDNKKIAKALSFFSDKKIDKVIFEYCDPIARTVTELYNFDFYSLLTENFKVVIYTDKLIFGNGIRALRYVTKEFYDKYAKEDDFSDSEICSCSYKETALTGLEGKEELQVDVTSIMRKAWGGKFQFAANPEQFFSSYVDLTGLPKITFKDEKSCDEFSRFFSTSSRKSKKSDLFQLNLTTREDEDTFCKLVIRESLPFG